MIMLMLVVMMIVVTFTMLFISLFYCSIIFNVFIINNIYILIYNNTIFVLNDDIRLTFVRSLPLINSPILLALLIRL